MTTAYNIPHSGSSDSDTIGFIQKVLQDLKSNFFGHIFWNSWFYQKDKIGKALRDILRIAYELSIEPKIIRNIFLRHGKEETMTSNVIRDLANEVLCLNLNPDQLNSLKTNLSTLHSAPLNSSTWLNSNDYQLLTASISSKKTLSSPEPLPPPSVVLLVSKDLSKDNSPHKQPQDSGNSALKIVKMPASPLPTSSALAKPPIPVSETRPLPTVLRKPHPLSIMRRYASFLFLPDNSQSSETNAESIPSPKRKRGRPNKIADSVPPPQITTREISASKSTMFKALTLEGVETKGVVTRAKRKRETDIIAAEIPISDNETPLPTR